MACSHRYSCRQCHWPESQTLTWTLLGWSHFSQTPQDDYNPPAHIPTFQTMVNVFLKYSIIIPFLIILFMRASSHSCVYNKTTMVATYTHVLKKDIGYVESSLAENFTNCCKTKTSPTFLNQCDSSHQVNKTKGNFKADCYNLSSNITFCCQFKNLVYYRCLINHHHHHLKPNNSSAVAELITRLTILVKHTDNALCMNLTNKSPGTSMPTHQRYPARGRCQHRRCKGGGPSDGSEEWQQTLRQKKECRKEICNLKKNLQNYETCWQEYIASNDCT